MGVKWTWHDLIPGLLLGLLFINSSRKFGAGLWFMLASSLFLAVGKITAGDWVTCWLIAGVLIGGGTVADTLLDWVKARFGGKADAPAPGS